jgi:hypothetical protein
MAANEATTTSQTKPELSTFGREPLAPGAYYLDLESMAAFPLSDNGQPSTFGDIYSKLRNAKDLKVSERSMMSEKTFEMNTGKVTVSGEKYVLRALCDLIELEQDGINPHRATWFYYDHDSSKYADELYLFFVVLDGKIVRERFSCIDAYPRVLTKGKVDDDPIWHAEAYEQEAWVKYWYRKFYMETLAGQLMVLRPDEPILYNYNRTVHVVTRDAAQDVTQETVQNETPDLAFVTLIKIYRLLRISIPLLVAIAFPILRPYMAVVAIVATADLLWTYWTTRKIWRKDLQQV